MSYNSITSLVRANLTRVNSSLSPTTGGSRLIFSVPFTYFIFIFNLTRCILPEFLSISSLASLPFLPCCHRTTTTFSGGPDKESALHLAARVNKGEKSAEMLLKSGANPNLMKFDGQTPLMLAAYNGNSVVMRLLIEYGADPLVRSQVSRYTISHCE